MNAFHPTNKIKKRYIYGEVFMWIYHGNKLRLK